MGRKIHAGGLATPMPHYPKMPPELARVQGNHHERSAKIARHRAERGNHLGVRASERVDRGFAGKAAATPNRGTRAQDIVPTHLERSAEISATDADLTRNAVIESRACLANRPRIRINFLANPHTARPFRRKIAESSPLRTSGRLRAHAPIDLQWKAPEAEGPSALKGSLRCVGRVSAPGAHGCGASRRPRSTQRGARPSRRSHRARLYAPLAAPRRETRHRSTDPLR